MANQVLFEESTGLCKAYLGATKRAHGYLLLVQTQDSEDRHRFRTNVFRMIIIYVAIDDETNKGELSHSTRYKKCKTEIKGSNNFRRRKELINSLKECVLYVLIGNIPLCTCLKR